jgi:hypothetical protein
VGFILAIVLDVISVDQQAPVPHEQPRRATRVARLGVN